MTFARTILLTLLMLLFTKAVAQTPDSVQTASSNEQKRLERYERAIERYEIRQQRDSIRKALEEARVDSLERLDSIRKREIQEQRELNRQKDSIRRMINALIEEPSDSLSELRNERLFDSIESKASRSKVSKLLYDLLVTEKEEIAPTPSGVVVDQSKIYQPFQGRRIRSIEIERIPVFDANGNWLARTANSLHIQTRERVIRRDLFFKEGDTINPQELVRNMQLLNSRNYISQLALLIVPDSLNSQEVTMRVLVRDSWTISVNGSGGGDGETMVGIFDENILGWGTRLNVETNFDRRDFSYGGNIVQYKMPNIGGSFYSAEILGGRKFKESTLHLSIGKELLRPTDYGVGSSFIRDKTIYSEDEENGVVFSRIKKTDLWGGLSHSLRAIRANIFAMFRLTRTRFEERPEVESNLNPAYHESDELLGSIGLYREHFLTTNMIYGYGTREYIGTGYQAEVIGGYHWGEYHNGYYLGSELKAGEFFPWGYAFGGVQVGTYLRPDDGAWFRSLCKVDLKYISNLLPAGRFFLRELAKFNYTQGWNRMQGNNETINFNDENGIRALKEVDGGINRCTLNTETVLFTPYQPWGFRITLFGFADFGLLGNHANPFQNDFYSAIGVGIRIKNERLIFSAIQLQLGIAFGKAGLLNDRWYRFSSQRSLNEFRFRPEAPIPVSYD